MSGRTGLIYIGLALLVWMLATIDGLLAQRDVSFIARRDFLVERQPRSVAIADFNGDKIPDLATANGSLDDNVSILLGQSDGTFGPTQNLRFGLGSTSDAVAIGDFNGDKIPDLVVANGNASTVSILLGNGDGTFRMSGIFAVGSPTSVAVGDFNGDGLPDLAVANIGSHDVSILLGNGDGTFGLARNFGVGQRPTSVTVGDLNGDDIPDLAVANETSNTASILLGKGDGTFAPARSFPVGFHPASIAIANFDGDAIPDLAVANNVIPEIRNQPSSSSIPVGR